MATNNSCNFNTGNITEVLTSNGTPNAPTFQAGGGGSGITRVNVQIFSPAGSYTYTPTAGMAYCIVELVGGGGGSGGVGSAGALEGAVSAGGGAGGYAYAVFDAATIGAGVTVVIGAGGTAGTNVPTTGGNGSASTFVNIATLAGGGGSGGQAGIAATNMVAQGGGGGTSGSGSALLYGCAGQSGSGGFVQGGLIMMRGGGGSTVLGTARQPQVLNASTSGAGVGDIGSTLGRGASGSFTGNSGAAQVGAAGGPGFCRVTEFII